MDAVVVGPGELCGVVVPDLDATGADGVELVSCGVRGAQDELVEADALQAIVEVCGVLVGGVVKVEFEVTEEHVVFGVDGEGGDKVGN